jgi:hypothetical protein
MEKSVPFPIPDPVTTDRWYFIVSCCCHRLNSVSRGEKKEWKLGLKREDVVIISLFSFCIIKRMELNFKVGQMRFCDENKNSLVARCQHKLSVFFSSVSPSFLCAARSGWDELLGHDQVCPFLSIFYFLGLFVIINFGECDLK